MFKDFSSVSSERLASSVDCVRGDSL